MTHSQTIRRALKIAAKEFNVHEEDILCHGRTNAKIRGCIYYALRSYGDIEYITLEEIGFEFKRDHTTIIYWLEKINSQSQKKTELWQRAERIAKELKTI